MKAKDFTLLMLHNTCRYANKSPALEWYKKLRELNIPHLVCLTHGDILLEDVRQEGSSTQAITQRIKVCQSVLEHMPHMLRTSPQCVQR